jgi:beta-barrel assembly-enhancing protease
VNHRLNSLLCILALSALALAAAALLAQNPQPAHQAQEVHVSGVRVSQVQLKPGETPPQVQQLLGKPDQETTFGENLTYIYSTIEVIFKAGRLTGVTRRPPQGVQSGGFLAGVKPISGQGSPQTVATATAGSKSVGEGQRIANVTPTPADQQAVAEMERSTVAQADLASFKTEGALQAQALTAQELAAARGGRPAGGSQAGVSGAAGQAGQVSDSASAISGRLGGIFNRVKVKQRSQTVQTATAPLTLQEEQEIGREVAAKVIAYFHVYQNNALTRYVNLVGANVAAEADRRDISYHFAVLDSADPNAISAPGGYVFITLGAVTLCQDESQLAGVLAHEVAHVNEKHVLHVLERDKQLRAGENEASSHVPGSDYFKNLSSGALVKVVDQGLAPDDEFDADRLGATYAHGAGYPAEGLNRFLASLAQATNQGANSFWTRTHPPVDQRNQHLDQLVAGNGWNDASRPLLAERFTVQTAEESASWTVPIDNGRAAGPPVVVERVSSGGTAESPAATPPPHETGVNDDTIVSEINAKLWQDSVLKNLDIDVTSENGVVTLAGKVKTPLQKAAVQRIAKSEKGVVRVVNQLTVSH